MAVPPERSPGSEQAELVRKAIARKPPGPGDRGPDRARRRADPGRRRGRKAGVAVVAVGRPLAGDGADGSDVGEAPAPRPADRGGRPSRSRTSAATLVAAAISTPRTASSRPTRRGDPRRSRPVDSLAEDRVEALRDALQGGRGQERSRSCAFERTIKDGEGEADRVSARPTPKTALVFAVDAGGMLRRRRRDRRPEARSIATSSPATPTTRAARNHGRDRASSRRSAIFASTGCSARPSTSPAAISRGAGSRSGSRSRFRVLEAGARAASRG